jgi:hypothetical protein
VKLAHFVWYWSGVCRGGGVFGGRGRGEAGLGGEGIVVHNAADGVF